MLFCLFFKLRLLFIFFIISVLINYLYLFLISTIFNLKLKKFKISPIIAITAFVNLKKLRLSKRLIFLSLYYLLNFISFFITKCLNYKLFSIFSFIHLSIIIFNLLPLPFLNGGIALNCFFNHYLEKQRVNKIIIIISKLTLNIILLSSIIQMILFNYNITLLCLYAYLKGLYKKSAYNSLID